MDIQKLLYICSLSLACKHANRHLHHCQPSSSWAISSRGFTKIPRQQFACTLWRGTSTRYDILPQPSHDTSIPYICITKVRPIYIYIVYACIHNMYIYIIYLYIISKFILKGQQAVSTNTYVYVYEYAYDNVYIYVVHTYHKAQIWMCPPTAHRGLIPRIIAHGLALRSRNLCGTSPPFAYAGADMLSSWGIQPPSHGSSHHGQGMCRCRPSPQQVPSPSLEGPALSKHMQIYVYK